MDSKAIIGSEVVDLDIDEIKGAAEFHKTRIAFGKVNGVWVFNADETDDRDHQHWICEDYGLSVEQFEKILRGYMVNGEVYFYKGTNFGCVNLEELTCLELCNILDVYTQYYAKKRVTIYNGVTIGKVGERWPGKEIVFNVLVD